MGWQEKNVFNRCDKLGCWFSNKCLQYFTLNGIKFKAAREAQTLKTK